MMMSEFTESTGFEPTAEQRAGIGEQHYSPASMYTLDLTHPDERAVYSLGERFGGSDKSGRTIGFTNCYMEVDGEPFFGISGELHYCRVSPDQWEDSVLKMRMGGINIISTYVFWNVHEEIEDRFRFDGSRDVRRFLEICWDHQMMVILRIGPFDHGEMRNGGLPDWLYGKPFEVRSNDEGYLACVRRMYAALHRQVDGLYFSQGGPVVGIQIENEYMHSSAPWEITTGATNEWINGGNEGNAHMLALKRIVLEEGLVVPFYTCTAWGGAMTPVEEMLPLWGGYAYRPWIFYDHVGEHPCTPEYHYRDNHNNAVPKTYNFEPFYEPESRPYACCEMMGGMMCSYKYRFALPMKSVDAMANIKIGSGGTLLGYYMYRGGTTPTGERTPFLNEGQVCKRSYDYQAPIGEFGQLRESWFRLRSLHDFCASYSDRLLMTHVVLPDGADALQPEDATTLRHSVRVSNGSGFVFVNNFQDHLDLPDRRGERIGLRLPGETITIGPFDLAGGENAILPFNLPMNEMTLKWAAAQPVTRLRIAGTPTHFFLAPDGMKPEFHFESETITAVEGCDWKRQGKTWVCGTEPDNSFTVSTAEGKLRVVVMSRETANRFCHIRVNGEEVALLADGGILWDGERLKAEHTGGTVRVLTCPGDVIDGAALRRAHPNWSIEPDAQGIFSGWRITYGVEKPALRTDRVGPTRYTVSIPTEALSGHKTVILRIRYAGDVGQAFIDGEMISDNFCNGQPWDVRVDSCADRLIDHPLTLYIVPLKQGATVHADTTMAARSESVEGIVGEVDSLEMVCLDDLDLPLRAAGKATP